MGRGARPHWGDLERELDLWHARGEQASLWWRDDDGGPLTDTLERLLRLAAEHDVGVAMAVIPEHATAALAEAVREAPHVAVYQHGFSHRNHRCHNGKASEYPPHRDGRTVAAELAAGWQRLEDLFADRARRVFVPPWGHAAEGLVAALPSWGYRGLSRFDPRSPQRVAGLLQVNAHCDLVKWRPEPHFRGEVKCLWHLVTHLEGRRRGTLDPAEPTGVLTHAYDLDDACYAFLNELLALTQSHPAAKWLPPDAVFEPAAPAPARGP